MDGFLKPFLPICSVDVWLSRYAHFYQHLLKKVLLEADPTPSMSQRFSGKEIPRKEPQNEGLLENDLYLLTQGDDAGQDFGGIPEAGGWSWFDWCFWSGINMGMAWPFPPPAKLTYCWKTCRHATTGVGGFFSGLNQNPWAIKLARWWVADPWGVS